MKSHLLSASLAALLFMVAGCTRTPTEPATKTPTKAEDEAAIKILYENFDTAQNARDAAGQAADWTDDAIVMPQDAPAIIGRDALKSSYQAGFEQGAKTGSSTSLKQVVEEVEVAGDWAYSRATFTSTSTPKAGAGPTQATGKVLCVHRRQPDGSWKTYRACWNLDKPLSSAAK